MAGRKLGTVDEFKRRMDQQIYDARPPIRRTTSKVAGPPINGNGRQFTRLMRKNHPATSDPGIDPTGGNWRASGKRYSDLRDRGIHDYSHERFPEAETQQFRVKGRTKRIIFPGGQQRRM